MKADCRIECGHNAGNCGATEKAFLEGSRPGGGRDPGDLAVGRRSTIPGSGFEYGSDRGGPSFGVDYSTVFLGATESLGRDESGGGMVRFFGSWELAGGESHTGTLVWKVEHRHGYTDSGSLTSTGGIDSRREGGL